MSFWVDSVRRTSLFDKSLRRRRPHPRALHSLHIDFNLYKADPHHHHHVSTCPPTPDPHTYLPQWRPMDLPPLPGHRIHYPLPSPNASSTEEGSERGIQLRPVPPIKPTRLSSHPDRLLPKTPPPPANPRSISPALHLANPPPGRADPARDGVEAQTHHWRSGERG